MTRHKPVLCLCSGLGPIFAIERVALKPIQFSTIDGSDVLEGAWLWSEMADQVRQAAGSVMVSYDAGQYVCESTYWSLLSCQRKASRRTRASATDAKRCRFRHSSRTFPLNRSSLPFCQGQYTASYEPSTTNPWKTIGPTGTDNVVFGSAVYRHHKRSVDPSDVVDALIVVE